MHVEIVKGIVCKECGSPMGKMIDESDVLVLDVEDRPGELGRVCRRIADAGVNIYFFYVAANTRIVLGVDDIEKAKSVL